MHPWANVMLLPWPYIMSADANDVGPTLVLVPLDQCWQQHQSKGAGPRPNSAGTKAFLGGRRVGWKEELGMGEWAGRRASPGRVVGFPIWAAWTAIQQVQI